MTEPILRPTDEFNAERRRTGELKAEKTEPKSLEKSEKDKGDPSDKALKKMEVERGLLLPSDKYRAQINAVKASQDLIELADKKARFALVIMSVLNAVAVLLVVRGGDAAIPKHGILGKAIIAELGIYAAVTVYYVWQAIRTLRPRGVNPPPINSLPTNVEPGISMRVLFYADIIARDRKTYGDIWANLRMDNLTSELSDQLYVLSIISRQKYEALDKLYFGLTVMTGMLVLLIATVGLARVLT